jgi:hypothetical protein
MSYSGSTEFDSLFHASRFLKIVYQLLLAYMKAHGILEGSCERSNEFVNKSAEKYAVIENDD